MTEEVLAWKNMARLLPFLHNVCVGSVTTLLLAETKESERMDTSSKQQRTYEESKRESGKRNGKNKEVETETGNWKSLNWESLKLETGK